MRGLAKRLAPDDVEYWGIAGLLHDLDLKSNVTGSMILSATRTDIGRNL